MSRRIVVRLLAAAGAVFGLMLLLLFCIGAYRTISISPHEDTATTMWMIKRRMLRFAHENNRLPTSLADLSAIPGHRNRNTDWWGNSIRFDVDADGIVTLRSAGGSAWIWNPQEETPLTYRFRAKEPTGNWSNEFVEFIREPSNRKNS
jgi:hypothetical protein